jgi:hypothetical protein
MHNPWMVIRHEHSGENRDRSATPTREFPFFTWSKGRQHHWGKQENKKAAISRCIAWTNVGHQQKLCMECAADVSHEHQQKLWLRCATDISCEHRQKLCVGVRTCYLDIEVMRSAMLHFSRPVATGKTRRVWPWNIDRWTTNWWAPCEWNARNICVVELSSDALGHSVSWLYFKHVTIPICSLGQWD